MTYHPERRTSSATELLPPWLPTSRFKYTLNEQLIIPSVGQPWLDSNELNDLLAALQKTAEIIPDKTRLSSLVDKGSHKFEVATTPSIDLKLQAFAGSIADLLVEKHSYRESPKAATQCRAELVLRFQDGGQSREAAALLINPAEPTLQVLVIKEIDSPHWQSIDNELGDMSGRHFLYTHAFLEAAERHVPATKP